MSCPDIRGYLYGSEYLAGVGVRINQREKLRTVGKATVLECQIPGDMIDEDTWESLAGEVLESIFERIRDPDYYESSINFGFYIKEPLPPSAITKIHHPTGIPNPLMHGILED